MYVKAISKSALFAAALGCLTLGFTPTSALAATATSPMAVSATVQATCVISAGAMAFGTYTGVVLPSTASISVTCTNTTPYNVGLDGGLTGTVTSRVMKSGAVALNYGLYTEVSHATNWGNSAGSWVAGTGNGTAQSLTVYGQIPAGQYVTPGTYSASVLATVNY